MTNAKTWQDIFYETTADSLVYSVLYLGEEIFYGRAVKNPSAASLRINITKICRDWLEAQVPSFSDGLYQGLNYGVFDLVDENLNTLGQYGFLFNWDYESQWDGSQFVMSNPINGRMDSRMMLFYSVFEDTTGQTICREEEFIKKLRIIPAYFEVGNSGVTRTIEVIANYDYTVTNTTDWLHISPLSGSIGSTRFTVVVDPNPLGNERSGYIMFDDNALSVEQTEAPLIFEVYPTSFQSLDSGGTFSFSVTANTDYTISTDESWITLSASSGTSGITQFNFTVSQNQSGSERNGYITVGNAVITVTQYGEIQGLSVSPSTLNYAYEGGSQNVTVVSDSDYQVTTDDPWITLSASSGTSGITTVTITTSQNGGATRTGVVYIGTESVTVNQAQFVEYIEVSPNSLSFSYSGDVLEITVTANTDYVISTNYPWLTLSQQSGTSGVTTITVTASANDGNADRNGSISVGSSSVSVTQAYNSNPDYQHLAMDILSSGTIVYQVRNKEKPIYYKLNDDDWVYINPSPDPSSQYNPSAINSVTINVTAGDIIKFKGYNTSYAENYSAGCGFFSQSSTALFNLRGNILSLSYGDAFAGKTIPNTIGTYSYLFCGTGVVDAEELVLTNQVTRLCYYLTFSGCTSLVVPPELPATVMVASCYSYMFEHCHSLVTAPDLPATTLAEACYSNMFAHCTGLVNAPALDCTDLDAECYKAMFIGCTSLTTAPELPAQTLKAKSYQLMFSDCSSLSYIKCLATNISATYCTDYWVGDVSASGTFVRAQGSTWSTGTDGIPSGWTVVEV